MRHHHFAGASDAAQVGLRGAQRLRQRLAIGRERQPRQLGAKREVRLALVTAYSSGDLDDDLTYLLGLLVDQRLVRYRPHRAVNRLGSILCGEEARVDLIRDMRQKRREELDRVEQ